MPDQILLTPSRATDWEGLAMPGARAFFFLSGTTTPATVYADEDEEIPHPTPLVADAFGAFPRVWSSQNLRVIVQDEGGQVLPGYPVDPAPRSANATTGAQTVSFSPTAEIPESNTQAAIERVRISYGNEVADFAEFDIEGESK
jgi:hypothetical protein